MRCFKVPALFLIAVMAIPLALAEPQPVDGGVGGALQQAEAAVQRARASGLLSDEVLQQAQQIDPAVLAEMNQLVQSTEMQNRQRQAAAESLGWASPASDLGDAAIEQQVAQKERALAGAPEHDTAILFTLSMPEAALRELFTLSETQGVPIYLNGLAKGTSNIPQTLKLLQVLAERVGATPNVYINPTVFEELHVAAVPAMIVRSDSRKGVIYGLLDVDYAKQALASSDSAEEWADLGTHGQTYPVEELSLVDEMKRRLATVDWEGKKRQAVEGYWTKHQFNRLPRATETTGWYIDPTIRVKQDIRNGQGVTLAQAGEVLNPVTRLGISMSYVVIDGTDPQQVAWAATTLKTIKGQFQVMVSDMPTTKGGWDDLADLRRVLGAPVFMLPTEAVTRFKLTGIPALISTTNDGYLKVLQQALDTDGQPIPLLKTNAQLEAK